jgi:hypothetical protein
MTFRIRRRKRMQISETTPMAEVLECVWAITWSEAGSCRAGVIVHKDDPRVALCPGAFVPLLSKVEQPSQT